MTLDDKLAQNNEGQEKDANEAIDEIYSVVRKAVSNELAQIDELFLEEAANQNKAAFELELTNLLFEKDEAEKQLLIKREVKQFLERTKREVYAQLTQNDQEKAEKAKRRVLALTDDTGEDGE